MTAFDFFGRTARSLSEGRLVRDRDGGDANLYDPQFEHDSCGVGFVADIGARRTPRVLEAAIEALANLAHRGALDADGMTGDGAGVMTQIPHSLFGPELERVGRHVPSREHLAVGVCFLPREDEGLQRRLRRMVERAAKRHGLVCLGWRPVPVSLNTLGAKAASSAPVVQHLLIGVGVTDVERCERTLYLLRREIENEADGIDGFYIPSLSSRTMVYKGLMTGSHLAKFYEDLRDPSFDTSFAIFHQRYSTNTFPNWALAQPFRMLAHNGEINTIAGNRIWMRAREANMASVILGDDVERVKPVVQAGGSDSCSLDNTLELMVRGGRDAPESMMILVPEAECGAGESELSGFREYAACLMEPWDGPAALVFSDGRFVGAKLDRNGLRPARYVVTNDGMILMASEAGAVDLPLESIALKGRLGPGEMIAVDTETRRLLTDWEIKIERARRRPYAEWVRHNRVRVPPATGSPASPAAGEPGLIRRMKAFGYTLEDVERVLEPMFNAGKEAAGSMGDDTPLAVLSSRPRPLYHYFRQRFAQVTNPAIDPIRERAVMSLHTLLGPRGSILEDGASNARLLELESPVITSEVLNWLRSNASGRFPVATLDAVFSAEQGEAALTHALDSLCKEATTAVDGGAALLVLSDRGVSEQLAAIPMLLAVGAVHHRLIRNGRRLKTGIIAEAGDAREEHHVASLIGYGAGAVCPWLALQVVESEAESAGKRLGEATRNYISALENGLLKIMAKMGIATVASYCGAQVFEAIGLNRDLVDAHFCGTAAPVGGAGLEQIARDILAVHRESFENQDESRLDDAGYYRYRRGGEFHAFNPAMLRSLHLAMRSGDKTQFEQYRLSSNGRPATTLRDLMEFKPGAPIPVSEVEPATSIVRRFCTSGMSLGALSRETHETIAIAMNRIGARSNSGEGGEDPSRHRPRENGDDANSRIKQIASARFGVTPRYLVSADEIEIKIAQGSKPGEGGQLPGSKVTAEIASLRHSTPGVALISPPPHHDIYSIEDLAQLIFDLKQLSPRARIAVKLVSESGVGTVAAGVTKAKADVIHISGHDGGTGASPLGSIKNAGTPWEIGLAETHQVLTRNGLRERVVLRVDGGLKTGRDVVVAAMLGADEFGFATAAVVALGCVMARQCHLNTCPVGIATQAHELRARFAGRPEMLVEFMMSLAEDVKRELAGLGFKTLDEIVGRSDLLTARSGIELSKRVTVRLDRLMGSGNGRSRGRRRDDHTPTIARIPLELGERVLRDARRSILSGESVRLDYPIRNTDRSVGARLAGEVTRQAVRNCRCADLKPGTLDIQFHGSAGQSFGAFLVEGIRLTLIGDVNDYVGKGMAGGEIVIRPPEEAAFDWAESVILGNTVMYGATGGTLLAAGRAGERFCVRNSGGTAVVEGLGDHGCEYMTGGVVVVLGAVGKNFAAGMTGGVAYVWDAPRLLRAHCNRELVRLETLRDDDEQTVRALVERHLDLTGSHRACEILLDWRSNVRFFMKVTASDAAPAVNENYAGQNRWSVASGGRPVSAD
jgi:glutamate synthase (ferredoxin)